MSTPRESVLAALEEVQVLLDGVKPELDEMVDALDHQHDVLMQMQAEIDEERASRLRRREEFMPLRSTVEFLSLGRLTIGPVYGRR